MLLCLISTLHALDISGFTPDQILEYKQAQKSDGATIGLNLQVFTPKGHLASDSRPVMVFFHGGGWSGGSPSQFHPHCEYLASRGMVAISVEYRLGGEHGTTPKECVKDGKSAIRWIRQNAGSLGIDPDKIIAGGGSAGGHIAAATGTLTGYEEAGENLSFSSKPNALVLFNPVFDNGPTGYGYNRVSAYWQSFSPLHNIDSSAPPTVIFLGTEDKYIPVATAENYKALMGAEGLRCDLHLYDGQPHGFFNYGDAFDGYHNTTFRMDQFLVSLGYLDAPLNPTNLVTNWVSIFGNASFADGSEASASPITTDADGDSISSNFNPVTLEDGEFIMLTGVVSFNAPISSGNFRIGLFDGDNPVTALDGSGYIGIWAEAPATAATKIAAGDGTGLSHPFETTSSSTLGSVPAALETVPTNTPIEFTLMIARNGENLDISINFTDNSSYNQSQNLLNQPVADYLYDSVAFLMTGNLNATQGSYSNIKITSGSVLPGSSTNTSNNRTITYIDAASGSSGNTYVTDGGSLADESWVGADGDPVVNNKWNKRNSGNGGDLYQDQHNTGTNTPELTTQITGLSDGTYTIYAFYWDQVTSTSQNWTISTGLTSGSLESYSSIGQPTVTGATPSAVDAGTLSFDTSVDVTGLNSSGDLARRLYGVDLGEVTVSGGSVINVYVDNLIGGGSEHRTWYDGVGYALAADNHYEFDIDNRLFGVEFNRNDALGSPSQSRFRVVSGSTAQADNLTSYTKQIGGYQVTITQPDGIKFEFRGANTDDNRAIPGGDTSRSFLVADFIATRQGALDINITDLAAGDYIFRSWHLDTLTSSQLGFAQGATTTTQNMIEARIGGVVLDSVQPTALGASGLNTTSIEDEEIPRLEFAFSHDGSPSLSIKLRSTIANGTGNYLLLNGFELFKQTP